MQYEFRGPVPVCRRAREDQIGEVEDELSHPEKVEEMVKEDVTGLV
jgi:hypothetical protein